MANFFKVDTLILTKQQIRASGDNSMLYINGIEVVSGVSNRITLTGQALLSAIAQTGQAAWTHGQNNAINLSGSVANTGSQAWNAANNNAINLSGRDTSISGGLEIRIALTGQTAWTHSQNNALNLSGRLTQSGTLIGIEIDALSGNLGATGSSLFDRDTSISGGLQVQISSNDSDILALGNRITLTGQNDRNNALNISGNLNASGRRAWDDAVNLSGRLLQSGSILDTFIDAVSGNLILTGQGARNNALNLSGALTQTGSILLGLINTASVSAANAVYTTGVQFISGVKYFLQPIYADTLYVTGSQFIVNTQDLYVGDNWIVLNATGGARDSAIFISTGLTGLNATGAIFGFDVPSNSWRFGMGSQQTDLLSLPRLASGEDIDSLNARLIQSGYGLSMHILTLSGNINASGRRAWDDAINLSGRLFATGALIAGVSGGLQAQITSNDSDIAGLRTNLTLTGQHGTNNALNISGRLALTGSLLDVFINALSGNLIASGQISQNNALNISGKLFETGREAVGNFGQQRPHGTYLDFLTIPTKWGWSYVQGNTGAPHQNSSQWYRARLSLGSEYHLGTGANSYWLQIAINRIGNKDIWFQTNENGTTGQWIPAGVTVSGVLQSGILSIIEDLTLTGQALRNNDLNLSGNLNASGRRAWDDAINLSGYLFATGSTLNDKINSLSGYNDNFLVHRVGTESISGKKIFSYTRNDEDVFVAGSGSEVAFRIGRSGILAYQVLLGGGNLVLDTHNCKLYDYVLGNDSIAWSARLLSDRNGSQSISWADRILHDKDVASLDWRARALSGEWKGNITGVLPTTLVTYFRLSGLGNTLSGDLNATGRRAWNDAINLSGRLNASGRRAWDDAINLSGRLFTTGSTLNNKINSLSGFVLLPRENSLGITANYSVTQTDGRIYCNNTNSIILTYPSAVTFSGHISKIKLINTGFVIFTGIFGQKFDGSDSYIANGQYNTYEIHSNGANWYLW